MRPSWQVSQLVAHPDGKSLWALSGEHVFHWDVATGETLTRWNTRGTHALFVDEDAIVTMDDRGLWRIDAKGATALMHCGKDDQCYHAWRARTGGLYLVNTRVKNLGVWDVATKKAVVRFEGEWGLADLAPDGSSALCVVGERTTVQLRGTAKSKKSNVLRARTMPESRQVRVVRYVAPDAALVSLSDATVERWDLATLEPVWSKTLTTYEFDDLCVTPDGSLAAGRNHNSIVVFRPADGALVTKLDRKSWGNIAPYHSLALAPDGSWLAFAAKDTQVVIVDLPSGSERPFGEGHSTRISALAWLPDNARVVSAGLNDRELRVWDVVTGATERTIELEYEQDVSVMALAPTPDGRSLFTGWNTGVGLHEIDLRDGVEVRSNARAELDSVNAIHLARDGEEVIFGYTHYEDGAFAWRRGARDLRWRIKGSYSDNFCAAAWGPDGREAFVFQGATLRVVDARTGERHRQQSLPNLYTFTSAVLLADGVTALIGVRYYDRSMYDGWSECWLWDTESGAARWRARADAACLMLSPDERWFAHETYTSVTFRSVRDGRELDAIRVDHNGDSVSCAALSPDGRRLAVGTHQGYVLLYAVDTDMLARQSEGSTGTPS